VKKPTHFIIHTIQLKPGTLDTVRSLFEEKVPQIAGHFDAWCGATLTADPEKNQIVSIGAWADVQQMQACLAQPAFEKAMGSLAEHFAGPPHTTITRVVTEVGPRA
jgi:quinol monooxygenase YgiN